MAFLVVMDQGDPPPFSTYGEAVKNLNKLYKLTIGALQRRVGKDPPQELIDDLEEARKGRNYLAHQYLVEQVEELDQGSDHRREMIRSLEATQQQIGDILRTITKLGREGASQIGLDPLAAWRFAEQLHDEGLGFGTIRHELTTLIAEGSTRSRDQRSRLQSERLGQLVLEQVTYAIVALRLRRSKAAPAKADGEAGRCGPHRGQAAPLRAVRRPRLVRSALVLARRR